MRQLLRTQIERPLIFIFYTGLIFFLLCICSCGTASESQNYCDQIAEIARTATLLLCEGLRGPDTVSANSPTNTLHFFTRVIAGDTVSFLTRTSKSGSYIISWKSKHNLEGAVLIEPLPIQAEYDLSQK